MQCRNKFLLHNPIATINKVLFVVDLKMPIRLFKHRFCFEDCFLEREKSLNFFQFFLKKQQDLYLIILQSKEVGMAAHCFWTKEMFSLAFQTQVHAHATTAQPCLRFFSP